jgi:hypothetical protein
MLYTLHFERPFVLDQFVELRLPPLLRNQHQSRMIQVHGLMEALRIQVPSLVAEENQMVVSSETEIGSAPH